MSVFPQLWLVTFLLNPMTPQNPPEVAPASSRQSAPKSPPASAPAPTPKPPPTLPSASAPSSSPPAPGASRPRRVNDNDKKHHDWPAPPIPDAWRLRPPPVPDAWRLRLPPVPPSTSPTPSAPKSSPVSAPKSLTTSSPASAPKSSPAPASRRVKSVGLIIPVDGARSNDLKDTFYAARSGGRVHRAIDIIVPRGTPVLAAADGEIVRVGRNRRGGKIIYQMSDDKKLVFYYAHLDRYAAGLKQGNYARQGDVIGYVGNTGNAGPGNYHLHFSISAVTDPKKLWKGKTINPYPVLRKAGDTISGRVRNRRK